MWFFSGRCCQPSLVDYFALGHHNHNGRNRLMVSALEETVLGVKIRHTELVKSENCRVGHVPQITGGQRSCSAVSAPLFRRLLAGAWEAEGPTLRVVCLVTCSASKQSGAFSKETKVAIRTGPHRDLRFLKQASLQSRDNYQPSCNFQACVSPAFNPTDEATFLHLYLKAT